MQGKWLNINQSFFTNNYIIAVNISNFMKVQSEKEELLSIRLLPHRIPSSLPFLEKNKADELFGDLLFFFLTWRSFLGYIKITLFLCTFIIQLSRLLLSVQAVSSDFIKMQLAVNILTLSSLGTYVVLLQPNYSVPFIQSPGLCSSSLTTTIWSIFGLKRPGEKAVSSLLYSHS